LTGLAAKFAAGLLVGVMNIRLYSLSSALVVAAALMVLFETLYFASQRPDYSHITSTISELGETGASQARQVACMTSSGSSITKGQESGFCSSLATSQDGARQSKRLPF
jgi:hypothetical protein